MDKNTASKVCGPHFSFSEPDRKKLIATLGDSEETHQFISSCEREIKNYHSWTAVIEQHPSDAESINSISTIRKLAKKLYEEIDDMPYISASLLRQGWHMRHGNSLNPDLSDLYSPLHDLELAADAILAEMKLKKGRKPDSLALHLISNVASIFDNLFPFKPSKSENSYFMKCMNIILPAANIQLSDYQSKVKKALALSGG